MEEEDKNGDGAGSGLKRRHTGEESDAKRSSSIRRSKEDAQDAPHDSMSPLGSDRGDANLETGAGESENQVRGEQAGELQPLDDGDVPEGSDEEKKSSTETEEDEAEDPARLEAIEALTQIEIEFATLRDQIHSDQLARFDLELKLCAQGIHPELETIEQRIRERRDKRTDWTRASLEYQLKCISNTTRAMREHFHQQFLKDRYDIRTKLLQQTTREWYQVNDERRAADKLVPEYGFRPDPAAQAAAVQAVQEAQGGHIPVLVALSKYQGFPTAPEITGATENELMGDLNQLRR